MKKMKNHYTGTGASASPYPGILSQDPLLVPFLFPPGFEQDRGGRLGGAGLRKKKRKRKKLVLKI
jgi:hypothetical protein